MVYIPKAGSITDDIFSTNNTPQPQNTIPQEEEDNSIYRNSNVGEWNYNSFYGNDGVLNWALSGGIVPTNYSMNGPVSSRGGLTINPSDTSEISKKAEQNYQQNLKNLQNNTGTVSNNIDLTKYITPGAGEGTTTAQLMTNTLSEAEARREENKTFNEKWNPLIQYFDWAIHGGFEKVGKTIEGASYKGLKDDASDDKKNEYSAVISQLLEGKKLLNNGEITQTQYDTALNEAVKYFKDDINLESYSAFAIGRGSENNVKKIIQGDVDVLSNIYDYDIRINELDPTYQKREELNAELRNRSINNIMTSLSEGIASSPANINQEELLDDGYASIVDEISDWNNNMHAARRVLNKLSVMCDGNFEKLDSKNYQIYQDILRLSQVYDKFEQNLAALYKEIPMLADPTTGKVVMPDIIQGRTLHQWLFDGVEDILTESDYGYSIFGHQSVSAQDVLQNMSDRIALDYSNTNRWFINPKRLWTAGQYAVGTVFGGSATELEQQVIGNKWAQIYNALSRESGELSSSYMDQDFTILSTMNTNNSRYGRTVQRYNASILEVGPEIVGGLAEVALGGRGIQRVMSSNTYRALNNKGLKLFSEAFNYVGKANTSAESLKNGTNIWKKIANFGKNVSKYSDDLVRDGKAVINVGGKAVTVTADELDAGQRLGRYLARDFLMENFFDQMWDARFAVADTEFGSDESFVISWLGTGLGTFLPKLLKTGIFGIGSGMEDATKMAVQDWLDKGIVKRTWSDGTTFDLVRLIDKDTMPAFDAMAKAKFGVNSSQLLSWEELASFKDEFKDMSEALAEVLKKMTPNKQEVTSQAMKIMLGQYVNQIYTSNSQLANRVWQLVADRRANPADIYKYVLNLRGTVGIGGWKSSIQLADNPTGSFVREYVTDLDSLPLFRQGGFGRALKEGFTDQELTELKNAGYEWANKENFKTNADGRYIFTTEGIEKAGADIKTQSMDIPIIAKISDTAESFDTLMKNSNLRKISDDTLNMVKESGAYDILAESLAELSWVCGLKGA